jgi:PAS domain S-box-containing protein
MTRRRAIDDAAIERLVDQRRQVVGRAVGLLEADRDVPAELQPEALRETVALLTVSLEELKVAEEELLQQNEELARTRDAVEANGRYFRRLFEELPFPYIVTDICGMILNVNSAAAELVKRPADLLEGKPMLTLVPLEQRSRFREAVNRLAMVDAARDWHVTLLRRGDAPVEVTVEARLARGRPGEVDVICWMLRAAGSAAPTA